MNATILKIEKHKSKLSAGEFYYIFFKGDDGHSYKTCIFPECRNYERWKVYIEKNAVGTLLSGLMVKKDRLFDADSRPMKVDLDPIIGLNGEEIKCK
jgi:hypothetical protein